MNDPEYIRGWYWSPYDRGWRPSLSATGPKPYGSPQYQEDSIFKKLQDLFTGIKK